MIDAAFNFIREYSVYIDLLTLLVMAAWILFMQVKLSRVNNAHYETVNKFMGFHDDIQELVDWCIETPGLDRIEIAKRANSLSMKYNDLCGSRIKYI